MRKSGIYTANVTAQSVASGGTINLGNTVRRFGCSCELTSSGIVCTGQGYYDIDATITITTTAAATVTVTAYNNGTAITGATATAELTDTAGGTIALPITGMIRKGCPYCEGSSAITFVLTGATATVNNIAVVVESA